MNKYYIANDKIDLKCYPNYSFEIGDVNGDGKMEFISMDQSGNLLRVLNLDNQTIFEKRLANNGNWGTPLVVAADIDNDGRAEVIVPDGAAVIAFDGKGNKIRERGFNECKKDDYGICVPLLGAAKIIPSEKHSIIACVAGGTIYALDSGFNIIWKVDGLRNDFSHEIFFADIDNDGFDEIALCTVNNIGGAFGKENPGDLLLLDHDGKILLRKSVIDYVEDSHFDDIAMGDFLGNGTSQILLEKGLLVDLKGDIIWDLSDQMVHGQWIAHTPNPAGKGKLVFISELWGNAKKSMLFTGNGKKINDISRLPWPVFPEPKIQALPSRCHIVRWDNKSEPEIFLTQQAYSGGHAFNSPDSPPLELIGLFLDLKGNLAGELRFNDAQIQGYYYNGEVHSRAADVDGDGKQEIIFPKQDGHVMIIKKS